MSNPVDFGKWLSDLITGPKEGLERAIKELQEIIDDPAPPSSQKDK